MASLLAETVQTPVALLVENVNVLRPLEAVAVSVIGDTPMATVETGAKVTVWIAVPIPAGWLIESLSLNTVTITAPWVGAAVLAAGAGAVLAGLYPAWRATRVDVVEALSLE